MPRLSTPPSTTGSGQEDIDGGSIGMMDEPGYSTEDDLPEPAAVRSDLLDGGSQVSDAIDGISNASRNDAAAAPLRSVEVVKRKRGRPRKDATKLAAARPDSLDADSQVSGGIDGIPIRSRKEPAAAPPPKDEVVKRKPGRPRKDATKPVSNAKVTKSTVNGQRRSSRVVEQTKVKVEKDTAKGAGGLGKGSRQQKDNGKVKAAKPTKATRRKEYQVESICGNRFDDKSSGMLYLVKWKGYSSSDNTWEPMENLGNCQRALDKYEAKKRKAEDKFEEETPIKKRKALES